MLKLREFEVLQGQGMAIADAVHQLERLKELEAENTRLRRAVSDLTLDKMILTEAAQGNCLAPFPPSPMH